MLSFALLAGAIFATLIFVTILTVSACALTTDKDVKRSDIAALGTWTSCATLAAALLWAAWATWGQHV